MALESTLDVEVTDETVEFTLRVRNTGDGPVDLQFRSGKRVDVAVYEAETGEKVWRWSEGRMFTQVLDTRTLESGEETAYEVTWGSPSHGSYRARATLAADRDVDAEATFSVP